MIEPTKSTKSAVDWEAIDFSAMSVDDRMALIGRIWESFPATDFTPPAGHEAEIRRRMHEFDESPSETISWRDVRQSLAREDDERSR